MYVDYLNFNQAVKKAKSKSQTKNNTEAIKPTTGDTTGRLLPISPEIVVINDNKN